MHPVIKKTFGGLTPSYYFRNLFFGILIALFYSMMFTKQSSNISLYVYFVISTLLYPYSRFVYESIVSFIVGNNIFIVNAFFMMLCKAATMMMCWGLSVVIAPIGLIYLYFHHTKNEKAINS